MPPCETINGSSSDSFDEQHYHMSYADLADAIESVEMDEEESVNTNAMMAVVDENTNRILDPIEMEATRTLIIVVTSFVSYQTVIFVTAYFVCRFVFGQLHCNDFKWMGPWVKILTLIPAFFGPFIFWMRNNNELRS